MRELDITANPACRFIFVFVNTDWSNLLSRMAKVSKSGAFFTGNGSALRTHLSRYVLLFFFSFSGLNICRSHYDEYLEGCKAKNVEAKAHPPKDWKGPKK